MFAVIKTGGKQYRVAAEDIITVMSLPGAPGEAVTFDEVLMLGNGAATTVGSPLVAGASVGAEIVEQARGPKVYAFKKRRRKNSKRKRGHRQDLTLVRILGFGVDGAAPVRAARAEPAASEAPVPEAPAHEAPAHEAPAQETAPAHDASETHGEAPAAESPKPE